MRSDLLSSVGVRIGKEQSYDETLGRTSSYEWGPAGVFAEILPGVLCTLWTFALLLWVLVV